MIVQDLGIATAYGYAKSKGYTGTEEEFALLMASYATVAEDAAESASQAETSATQAATSASNAAISATTASNAATSASTSAQTATTKAGEASTSASNAATSESNAASSASSASTSAQTATTKAGEASASATAAEEAAESINEPDATLTISGRAADSKATGDAIDEVRDAIPAIDSTLTQTGKAADAKAVGDAIAAIDIDTVNNARQLLSENYLLDKEPYHFRASGGDGADRVEECIVGGTVGWNQMVVPRSNETTVDGVTITPNASDGSVTLNGTATSSGSMSAFPNISVVSGHKYYAYGTGAVISTQFYCAIGGSASFSSGTIRNATSTGSVACTIRTDNGAVYSNNKMRLICIDLTTLFGPTIADYIYSLEQATAGAGVAWFRKLFPNDFYEYSAPTLKHVEGVSAKEVSGKNIFGGDAIADTIVSKVPNATKDTTQKIVTYTAANVNTVVLFDMFGAGQYTFISPTAQGVTNLCIRYTDDTRTGLAASGVVVSTEGKTIKCLEGEWNTGTTQLKYEEFGIFKGVISESDFVPYRKNIYPLDSTWTGMGIPKLDSNNRLYFDGDIYPPSGQVERRYGIVDLGTLTWIYGTSANVFYANMSSVSKPMKTGGGVISNKYARTEKLYTNLLDGEMTTNPNTFSQIPHVIIKDSSYTDAETFKTAMSGQYLVYEKATPTTETATHYTSIQTLDPNGTEEFVTTGIVPVGHYSKYLENLRSKIEGLPRDFSTLIAPTEVMYKATRNYTTGDLLIVDNILYKATANIANGGTITPNTNVTATTLAAVIAALA